MKWSITMLLFIAIAYWLGLAPPAGAFSRVSGYSFEITSVNVAPNGYVIHWDRSKRLLVFDSSHCGPPPPETAYRQIVETSSRMYETVFVGGCAYSAG